MEPNASRRSGRWRGGGERWSRGGENLYLTELFSYQNDCALEWATKPSLLMQSSSSAFQNCPQTPSLIVLMKLIVYIWSSSDHGAFFASVAPWDRQQCCVCASLCRRGQDCRTCMDCARAIKDFVVKCSVAYIHIYTLHNYNMYLRCFVYAAR